MMQTKDERRKTKAQSTLTPVHLSSGVFGMWPIAVLLVTFIGLATLYNVVVPLGEGPDESGHIHYVLFLAREGRLPIQGGDGSDDVPGEGHQPPLAYALAAPVALWLPREERQVALTANPAFVWNGGNEPHAFMRGSQELWPWEGGVLAWHLARGVSTVWGAVTVVCTWGVALRLNFRPSVALLAAGLVAFNPQFLFTSALVTNDALLAALSAGALLVVVSGRRSMVRDQPSGMKHGVWSISLGLLIGLALITKQSALLLLALLPLAAWWRYGSDWRRVCGVVAVGSVVVALVAGWWYWRNLRLYGDLFGLEAFRAEFLTQPWEWRDLAAWGGALVQLHESFWGRFGWMNIHGPDWWSAATTLLVLVALAGLARRAASSNRKGRWADYLLLGALPTLALAWTLSFALTAGLVAWQGRFLFPAIAPIAVLLAAGLSGWTGVRGEIGRQGNVGFRSPVSSLGAFLLVYGLGGLCAIYLAVAVIGPSYPWRVIPESDALARRGEAVYLRFAENWKQGVELRGWRQEGAWRPGETVRLTLTWHALEPASRNWTVFIHLVDESDEVKAEDNTPPLDGLSPMKLWSAGDWVSDPHVLVLPPDLEPGRYTLRVGLFDTQSSKGRRQGIWDEKGEFIGDAADVAIVTVTR